MNTINKISLVAAIGKNGEIGVDGSLPWVSSKELSVFKKITNGGIVIMGRKTFDSIGSKLNGRFNVVISESKDTQDQITKLKDPSIVCVDSIEDAIKISRASLVFDAYSSGVFVIGGSQVYSAFLDADLIDRFYLSVFNKSFPGADTFLDKSRIAAKIAAHSCTKTTIFEHKDSDDGLSFSTFLYTLNKVV